MSASFILSFRNVLLVSIVSRLTLILYSDWHDARSLIKFTDVDYRVFTDAADFLLHPSNANTAQGSIQHLLGHWFLPGNPYNRETYRYTPLLALLLTPNSWLHPSFGKYIFAACDIINGIIIRKLLISEVLPRARSSSHFRVTERTHFGNLSTLYSAIYLLNPLVFSISTRGSSESVLSLFVLLTLYAALKGKWDTTAVMLGLSTHWKIYPAIYGVGCLGVISSYTKVGRNQHFVRDLVNWKTFRFTVLSAGTFILLALACYAVWGYPFVYESYLYHLHRLDHRHNFSPYFYLIYLTYPFPLVSTGAGLTLLRSPLVSFLPQMGLALGTGLILGKRKEDLPFTWFVQTFVFVLLNKVCTSQYFLWYLLFLPLLLPRLSISGRSAAIYFIVWIGSQALWLSKAYKLEFLGENVYVGLWLGGLVYILGNCWVLVGIMDGYHQ